MGEAEMGARGDSPRLEGAGPTLPCLQLEPLLIGIQNVMNSSLCELSFVVFAGDLLSFSASVSFIVNHLSFYRHLQTTVASSCRLYPSLSCLGVQLF